jgi:hypothetical protein
MGPADQPGDERRAGDRREQVADQGAELSRQDSRAEFPRRVEARAGNRPEAGDRGPDQDARSGSGSAV